MTKEITVILKGDDSTYKHKFLCYDPFDSEFENKVFGFIKEAKECYKGTVEDVVVKMTWSI